MDKKAGSLRTDTGFTNNFGACVDSPMGFTCILPILAIVSKFSLAV